MSDSRRNFLEAAGATGALVPLRSEAQKLNSVKAAGRAYERLSSEILNLFGTAPGSTALKVWAPATTAARELLVEYNASERLFVGSAIKAFVLCERLRQLDSPDVVSMISQNQLRLDASVWSIDSRTMNPPNLSGLVTERTAMEAMIIHSDNTATDMEIAQTGRRNVERFLESAGLTNSAIPDSTRVFTAYLFGAPDYKTFSWQQLVSLPDDAPIVNSPLNNVETLASSCDDLVSFYSRSLQGEFFQYGQTLSEFRRILTLADAITSIPFPLGVTGFAKAGSIDVTGYHSLCLPGAMFFNDRWVYFSMINNWNAPEATDPNTVLKFVTVARGVLQLLKDGL
ncbi:MAG: serine hydrolase [Bryobacteraceae bacterium]